MVDEKIDIIDKTGKETGISKTKKEAHAKGLWHAASHIWIYNSNGEILLQRRSAKKDSWPGKWDISAAGHISSGETPIHCALRELKEEIGVRTNSKRLKKIIIKKTSISPYKGYYNNEFNYVYLLKLDKIPKKLQEEEVDSVKFIPLSRFEHEIINPKTAKKYVPHEYFPELIKILKRYVNINP